MKKEEEIHVRTLPVSIITITTEMQNIKHMQKVIITNVTSALVAWASSNHPETVESLFLYYRKDRRYLTKQILGQSLNKPKLIKQPEFRWS